MRTYTWKRAPKAVKERALDKNRYVNTEYHEWWEWTYEDAKSIGLEIDSFDCYQHTITGKLTEYPLKVIEKIKELHGPECDTYKLALKQEALFVADHLARRCMDEDDWEEPDEDLVKEFKYELLQAYLKILDGEAEYLESDEAIIETFEANDWRVDETGDIV